MMNYELQEMLKFVWKVKFPISKNLLLSKI